MQWKKATKTTLLFWPLPKAFMESEAGVTNAKAALEICSGKGAGDIDPKRIYSAGHSSAATLSLLLAAREPRLAGCIAYAPATNLEKRLPAQAVQVFSSKLPGFKQFLTASSPITNAAKITCPVFVFHAADDSNVPVTETEAFVQALKKTNKNVTFYKAKSGDHYESMMDEGIPLGIKVDQESAGEMRKNRYVKKRRLRLNGTAVNRWISYRSIDNDGF